jgi:hypothetical protein
MGTAHKTYLHICDAFRLQLQAVGDLLGRHPRLMYFEEKERL